MKLAIIALAVAGCSSVLGIDNLNGPPPSPDAPVEPDPDGPTIPPGGFLLRGDVAFAPGGLGEVQPVPGATVELVEQPAGVPGSTAITDDVGKFEMVIDAMGTDLSGAGLRARGMTDLATLGYFSRLISPDLNDELTIQVFESMTLDMFAQLCGLPTSPARSYVIVFSVDDSGAMAQDVPFSTEPPATFCGQTAAGSVGIVTSTGTSGFAVSFNPQLGSMEVSAGGMAGRKVSTDVMTVTEVVINASSMP